MIKFQADVPLADVSNAMSLRSRLEEYASNGCDRLIPDEAEMTVVTSSVGGERMDPVRIVPSALRFTWEG